MSNDAEFSFHMEPTSYKSQDLIYEEDNHKLVVYLEMSGVWKFDWVGCDTDFQKWTEPTGQMIPTEKQTQILSRLADWSRNRRLRIDIGPPMNMEEYFAEQEKAGHRVERRADGTVVVYPVRHNFWERLVGLTKLFFRR